MKPQPWNWELRTVIAVEMDPRMALELKRRFQGSGFGNQLKRIKLDVEKEPTQPGPLGLKLTITPSFMELIQAKLPQEQPPESDEKQSLQHEMVMDKVVNAVLNTPSAEKMKASNFAATFLKIGSWERVSRYDGDLVAKCYFAKRKLVWEVLEGGLKSKIEIQWSDITSLRTIYRQNHPDQLEIELSKVPHFFSETKPQPRKHTLWQAANDFTGGQAVTYRRHLIQFAEGTLEKHYEKMLQCDSRLHMLSKANFPSSVSPYFETGNQEYRDHGGHLSDLLLQNNSTIPYTRRKISNEIFHPPVQLCVQAQRASSSFNQGDFQHVRSAFDFDPASPSSVVDSPNSEEQGISNSDDGYMGGCEQYYEPAYSNIHDSFQGSYLNMPSNITFGNQVNHFSQGHVIPCYPSFPTNRAENISANQEVLESIARHLFCEPLVSESCNNQNQQMIMGMNSLSSLIGATGASMNASQQGDCYPLYQIVSENPDATGTLSSDAHIVPSSWGTSSHLVGSMPGAELQNNVYGVPSY
ncbi:uncharacterized protein LOC116255314 isoform X1 [Nymphaea colorata]|nr:uncharacterized protein LOC116255314 isoform X1 [Nymphaea colorata]XP_049933808.1 uncharacterized protein LOC116255314 isoform X1 [Nymphaea colorata]